jgi:hypothetical protein
MHIKSSLLLGFTLLLIVQAAGAQSPNPLVGAWERISMTDAQGAIVPQVPAFLIFSGSGHFAQTVTPAGRPKLNTPLQDMTREQLLARFQGLEARFGTYTVAGNKLTRKNIAHVNPGAEGTEETQLFRIEGDVLILTTEGGKREARFRRLQQVH